MTLASGTAAPVTSLTLPTTEPYRTWAGAVAGMEMASAKRLPERWSETSETSLRKQNTPKTRAFRVYTVRSRKLLQVDYNSQ